jgi:hypothetical protein
MLLCATWKDWAKYSTTAIYLPDWIYLRNNQRMRVVLLMNSAIYYIPFVYWSRWIPLNMSDNPGDVNSCPNMITCFPSLSAYSCVWWSSSGRVSVQPFCAFLNVQVRVTHLGLSVHSILFQFFSPKAYSVCVIFRWYCWIAGLGWILYKLITVYTFKQVVYSIFLVPMQWSFG